MTGNYLQLYQPKIGELFEVLRKEQDSPYYSEDFFNMLELQNSSDSVRWALNRTSSSSSSLASMVNDYLDSVKGARFEILSFLNGSPNNLYLRLLANKEMPSEFDLFGKLLIPQTLQEIYQLNEQNKVKINLVEGNPSWKYPLPGIIQKVDGMKFFLEFFLEQ